MPAAEQEQGRAVAQQAIEAAQAVFQDRLISAHLIGSLAHGGFVAAVSDVDVAFLLDGADPDDSARIQQVGHQVRGQDDSPLADRLSLFWTSQQSLQSGQPVGHLPAIDWLDLVESGLLAHGLELDDGVPTPSPERLVEESARFAVDRWGQDPRWVTDLRDSSGLIRQGRRAASKAALFPVRFLYTLDTGRGGVTDQAVDWYVTQGRPAQQLVEAAYRWRVQGFDDAATAVQLLDEQLTSLYQEFSAGYMHRLLEQDQPGLARDLSATIARLDSTTD